MPSKPKDPRTRTLIGERVRLIRRGKRRIFHADFWFDGQHRRRSLRTSNMKFARQRAVQLEAELVAGRFRREPPKVTIDDAVDRYLEFLTVE
ncbi:MAG: hypothetical protein ACYSWU_24655, partial [Planctomycetota bacterium]